MGDPSVPGDSARAESEVVSRIALANGLVIEDLRLGTGEICLPGSTVLVSYRGWLADGTVFDSTGPETGPRALPLGKLIEGWREGLAGMRAGGVRRLSIPASLAYGDRGSPALGIPPFSDLTYEIELVGVR